MFDYYGIDPKSPVDTVPLSQLPAFIRDAKKAFTSTFISGAEFEAGTVFGDAVFYDKDTQKWRRSVWIAGSPFNVDGFAVPQYQGVTTGALVHGSWMYEGGTELYLSAVSPGKIFPIGSEGVPSIDEGAFLVGKQITPGVILFLPGVSMTKAYADSAKLSAAEAREAELAAKESAEAAEATKVEITEMILEGKEYIDAAVAEGTANITTVVNDGILTVGTSIDQAKIVIQDIATQTINFVKIVTDEQLVIIRNAGAVARRELEIAAEKTIILFRSFVIEAQEAAGNARTDASLALAARQSADEAAALAINARDSVRTLRTTTVVGPDASVGYVKETNTLAFTLAQGPKGEQGSPAPAGDKGPTGDMGHIPFGAAFGRMAVEDGMLSLEYADISGNIDVDTFSIDASGNLVVADGVNPAKFPIATQDVVGVVKGSDTVSIDADGTMRAIGGGGGGGVGPVGPQGEKGEKGDPGPVGPKGDTGATGPAGSAPDVTNRLDSLDTITTTHGTEITALGVQVVAIDSRLVEVEDAMPKTATTSTLGLVKGSDNVKIAEDGRAYVIVGGVIGNGVFVGQWQLFRQNPLPPGYLALDGHLYAAASVQFPNLIEYLTARADELVTETEWQALSAAASGTGGVAFYVYDAAADTLRLPDTRGDSPYHGTVGTWEGDAIRNIVGGLYYSTDPAMDLGTIVGVPTARGTGAFGSRDGARAGLGGGGTTYTANHLSFDASKDVPTAPTNHPRRIGLTFAVYAGITGA